MDPSMQDGVAVSPAPSQDYDDAQQSPDAEDQDQDQQDTPQVRTAQYPPIPNPLPGDTPPCLTLEEMLSNLQRFATAHGFIVKRKNGSNRDRITREYNYWGVVCNKDTPNPSRSNNIRKRTTSKVGCQWGGTLSRSKKNGGLWHFKVVRTEHCHPPEFDIKTPRKQTPTFYAIIAGVGPGIGRACAIRFARNYPVILLSRNPATHGPIVEEVEKMGGRAMGIVTDVCDPASLAAAFEKIKTRYPTGAPALAVYNVNGDFVRKPFLELSLGDVDTCLTASTRGFFLFAQQVLPGLLEAAPTSRRPPTLVVSGATGSTRGSAHCGSFAAGKSATRAMAQSLAREFGIQGVHVAHAVIDGVVDTPQYAHFVVNGGVEGGKLSPEAIADSYWYLHTQPKSAFTQEIDLRPFAEHF